MSKFLILVISMLLDMTAQSTAASPQDRYLETRDGYIRKFANSTYEASSHDEALSELETQLRLIIGPIEIADFPKQGKINLETLWRDDGGFGQADGLRFKSGPDVLFVTTNDLLISYLREHKELPTQLRQLAKSAEFYSRVLNWDVAVTKFAEVPVKKTNDTSFAYAFLGLWAQDIGLFLPEHIIVFFTDGDHIFIESAEVRSNINQIAECKDVWEKFENKANAAFAKYRASGFKDQNAFNDKHKYEHDGFKAYCRCFNQKAKTEPFFKQLTTQAQTLVENIQKQSLPR